MNTSVGGIRRLGMRALLVDDEITQETATGRAVRTLSAELVQRDIDVLTATSADDAIMLIRSDPSIQCVLLDWDLGVDGHGPSEAVVDAIRHRNANVPIFLLADRSVASSVPSRVMGQVDDFVWLLEDTADFIGGRIHAAIERYRATVLPPMFGALAKFSRVYEYSWHTPGHTGGTGFLKSPVGRAFFEYFGEALFRSDLSISVGGSLLDHSDRRKRALRGPRVRRASHVSRDERLVDVEPHHPDGEREPRPDRAVRPQLPQVGRARDDDVGCHPDLPRADAQPLRDHRADRVGAPHAGGDPRGDHVESAHGRVGRSPAEARDRHELDVRRPVLQRRARRGAARRERRPAAFRRSVVRLRAFQPDLPRSPCDAATRATIARTAPRCSRRSRRTSC